MTSNNMSIYILRDDMGLGKTMQVSAFLAGLFHSGLLRRVLVIAPKTFLTHWIKELTVVGLGDMIRDYSGSSSNLDVRDFELQRAFKEGGILLTTYDIARNKYRLIRGDFYNDADDEEEGMFWNYVVLDEAHLIKNPKTPTAQSLFEIPCIHRIAISGTPIQNNFKSCRKCGRCSLFVARKSWVIRKSSKQCMNFLSIKEMTRPLATKPST